MASEVHFVGPDGYIRTQRIKSGSESLWDTFTGVRSRLGRATSLRATPPELAEAYRKAVWAYRCIKLRADAVAGIPLKLVDGDEVEIKEHRVLDLLDSHYNLSDLLRRTEAAYNIFGFSVWIYDLPLKPTQIQWLNPQTVEILGGADGFAGIVQTVGGRQKRFPPERVTLFRNFDPSDDLGGLSPLAVALAEVNAEINAAHYVAAFFENDARPAGLLTTDQPLDDYEIEKTRTWWQRLFGGVRNQFRTGIVGGGLKWQDISYKPKDLALEALREEDRRAISAVFGVPPAMAGAWEAANYATAREQKRSFYEDEIVPQMEHYADVLNASLLPKFPDLVARRARFTWAYEDVPALQEQVGEKVNRIVHLFRAGIITLEEAREAAGYGPPPEPELEEEDEAELEEGENDEAEESDAAAESQPVSQLKALWADELDKWQRFALKRVGKPGRPFVPELLPKPLFDEIQTRLEGADSEAAVKAVFDPVFAWLKAGGPEPFKPRIDPTPEREEPLPDITPEDIEAAINEWKREMRGHSRWYGALLPDEGGPDEKEEPTDERS